jgi:hypothetical protein
VVGTRTRHPFGRIAGATALASALAVAAFAPPAAAITPYFGEITGSAVNVGGTYVPLVGDFGGDELNDIIWYAPGAGTEQVWLGTQASNFSKQALAQQVGGTYDPVVGDFAGDGRDDILWYAPGAGQDHLWITTGSHTFTDQLVTINGTYAPVVLHDSYVGSGKDDILFQNGFGADPLWVFPDSGTGPRTSYSFNAPSGLALTGDFDGNGVMDLFFYEAGSGPDSLWRRATSMASSFQVTPQTVNGHYQPVVGNWEVGGDDKDDIIWFSSGPGADSRWAGAAGGTWVKTGVAIPLAGEAVRTYGKYEDTLFVRGSATDGIWYPTANPPGDSRPTGNTHPPNAARYFHGYFRDSSSSQLFFYSPGATAELFFT